MKATDLKKWIDSLTQDIDFSYNGVLGSICPISRTEIDLCYGDTTVTANSVDAAMGLPFIAGHCLNEVCEKLDI